MKTMQLPALWLYKDCFSGTYYSIVTDLAKVKFHRGWPLTRHKFDFAMKFVLTCKHLWLPVQCGPLLEGTQEFMCEFSPSSKCTIAQFCSRRLAGDGDTVNCLHIYYAVQRDSFSQNMRWVQTAKSKPHTRTSPLTVDLTVQTQEDRPCLALRCQMLSIRGR